MRGWLSFRREVGDGVIVSVFPPSFLTLTTAVTVCRRGDGEDEPTECDSFVFLRGVGGDESADCEDAVFLLGVGGVESADCDDAMFLRGVGGDESAECDITVSGGEVGVTDLTVEPSMLRP